MRCLLVPGACAQNDLTWEPVWRDPRHTRTTPCARLWGARMARGHPARIRREAPAPVVLRASQFQCLPLARDPGWRPGALSARAGCRPRGEWRTRRRGDGDGSSAGGTAGCRCRSDHAGSSAQGPSPTEAILLRTATSAEGVVEDPLPRLRGLALIVDHPAHLPFFGSYPNEAPPGVIRLQAGRTANGVVRESEGGDTVAGARVCAFWRDSGAFASFGQDSGARTLPRGGSSSLLGCRRGTSRRRLRRPVSRRTLARSRKGVGLAGSSSSW